MLNLIIGVVCFVVGAKLGSLYARDNAAARGYFKLAEDKFRVKYIPQNTDEFGLSTADNPPPMPKIKPAKEE